MRENIVRVSKTKLKFLTIAVISLILIVIAMLLVFLSRPISADPMIGTCLPIDKGGTGCDMEGLRTALGIENHDGQIATLQDSVDDLVNNKSDKAKSLYSGSFSSGTLTVPDISKYQLFIITLAGGNINPNLLCTRGSSGNQYIYCDQTTAGSSTARHASIIFQIPIDGDVITYPPVYKFYISHTAGDIHEDVTQITSAVTEIWGIM